MTASIVINQATKPPGTPGKARDDLDAGLLVTLTNATVEATYLWTLVDVPIRSALVRGTTSSFASFTFTPDVKGTYLVTLQTNGSTVASENDITVAAILSSGPKTLGWRYTGAGESEDADNLSKPGLGFVGDTNTRGWATDRDLQLEQTELAAYEVANAVTVSPGIGADNLPRLNPITGKLDPSLIPAAAGSSGPIDYVGALNEREDVIGLTRATGGFKLDGDDLASGRTLYFTCLAKYVSTAASGQAKLQLFDMGASAGAPAAGILRSELIIPYTTTGITLFTQALTAVGVPGINLNQVHDVPHKYEVRLFLDSPNQGDEIYIVEGGVRAE